LTGEKFVSTAILNVRHFEMAKHTGLKVRICMTFNGMTSLLNFIKLYQTIQTLSEGGQTAW
jgi:hypothetical protein